MIDKAIVFRQTGRDVVEAKRRDQAAPNLGGCGFDGCGNQSRQGRTRDEAMENIKQAIVLCLEVRAERGMPLTYETSDVEVAV